MGKKLGIVTSFKTCTLEQLFHIMAQNQKFSQGLHKQLHAALTKGMPIWRESNAFLRSKVKPIPSLVISIFLYAYESGTFTAVLEQRKAGL